MQMGCIARESEGRRAWWTSLGQCPGRVAPWLKGSVKEGCGECEGVLRGVCRGREVAGEGESDVPKESTLG